MTDENAVKLVNRDGKIVGIDPETGEEVPIKLGSGLGSEEGPVPDTSHFEALHTEGAEITENFKLDHIERGFESPDNWAIWEDSDGDDGRYIYAESVQFNRVDADDETVIFERAVTGVVNFVFFGGRGVGNSEWWLGIF